MEENDVFNENLEELKKLFPNQIEDEKQKELRKKFDDSEKCWNANVKRSSRKIIKYLLICEAPPSNGKYFYCNTNTSLFRLVWKTFYSTPICPNPVDAYQCLAEAGFLLVDTLPYAMNFTSRDRKKTAYHTLIKSCLYWWINKLNGNFSFDPTLKIAFGFKLNALSVIKATGDTIRLGGLNYPLTSNIIAASGAGQPTSTNLERIFQIASKQKCLRCP